MSFNWKNVKLSYKFQIPIVLWAIVGMIVTIFIISIGVRQAAEDYKQIALGVLDSEHQSVGKYLEDTLESKAKSLGLFMAKTSKDFILSFDIAALSEFEKEVSQDSDVVFAVYQKPDGTSFTKADIPLASSSILTKRFPIKLENDLLGYVLIGLSTRTLKEKDAVAEKHRTKLVDSLKKYNEHSIATILWGTSINIAILITVIVLIVSLCFRKLILNPINILAEKTKNFGKGDLGSRVPIVAKDEIGLLGISFNEMATDISSTTVSKDYVENVLSSMGEALFVIDVKGYVNKVNESALSILKKNEKNVIGMHVSKIISDERFSDKIETNKCCDSINEQDEKYLLLDSGKTIPIELTCTKFYDSDKKLLGTILLLKDISERLKAEEALKSKNLQLEKKNAQLDQFSYVVSHDLKAPLRAISNLSQWIEEDLSEVIEEDTGKNMSLLRGRVDRMESLINGILEYSRIGRTSAAISEVNVNTMLLDIIDGMPVPDQYKINIGEAMPALRTAGVPLSQVFSNLISNGIKYRESDSGKIEISAKDMGTYYEFSVADDGPGIEPKYHEKIFQIFQTLNARDKVESTGVGLSLVKKIVEEQGGEIILKSDAGQGAIFHFTWPKYIEEKAA